MPAEKEPSILLIQELFGSEDPQFIDVLRQASDLKKLAGFADRWKKDPRPWAKSQILAYLDLPLDRPGHQPIIKRLFKHAEQRRDSELVGAFMAAFDRLVRRQRKIEHHYDWRSRQVWEEERLWTPPGSMLNPKTLQTYIPRGGLLFSNTTRKYLRRRAWRYFRRMAYQNLGDYVSAVASSLQRYRDGDLARGENILDCWGLMHACFFEHAMVEFTPEHARIKPEGNLAQLAAAPYKSELWRKPAAAARLLQLVIEARSRLVRVWAMQLVRQHHKERLADVAPAQLIRLLDHEDEEVQQFGAELLDQAKGLEKLAVSTWLTMLKTRNLVALETICQLVRKHVTADRFGLEQLIEMAGSRAAPVAKLGLDLLRSRPIRTVEERQAIAGLADARCGSIGRELALWALGVLGDSSVYDVDRVAAFFDSLTREIRLGAWEWLTPDSAGYNDAALFGRLMETPYDESRVRLVEMLEKRSGLPGAGAAGLAGIWCSVLLGIHRGGRQKLKAMRQISRAVRGNPEHAQTLMPILAIAIRSVRAAEARQGLAALVCAVEARPELLDVATRFLPELDLSPHEVRA